MKSCVARVGGNIVGGNCHNAVNDDSIAVRIVNCQQVNRFACAVLYLAVLRNIGADCACRVHSYRAVIDINFACNAVNAVSYHIRSAGAFLDQRNNAVFDIDFVACSVDAAADNCCARLACCVKNRVFYSDVCAVCVLTAADCCAKDAFCVDYTAVDGNIVCFSVITAADACALAAFCIDSAAVYDNVACRFVIIASDSRREGRTCRIKSAAAAAADMTGFSAVLAGYGERSALVTV